MNTNNESVKDFDKFIFYIETNKGLLFQCFISSY